FSISELNLWTFVAGTSGNSDTIGFQTVDSHGLSSASATAAVTVQAANNPPNTPVGHDQTNVAAGSTFALSTLFTGLTDPDAGDSVTQFYVRDRSQGGGHLFRNNVQQTDDPNLVLGPFSI